MASDSEIALGCDDIEFACDHEGCVTTPTGLWKDPNSTAPAIALCDEHIEDSAESAVCIMDIV
jgi:hypothetical protein